MRQAERAVRRGPLTANQAVRGIGAFVRFSALGGSVMLPQLGVASGAGEASVRSVALATAIGVTFHVFAYVLNDVADLRIDRTDPRRVSSPLVLGAVTPQVALSIALVMLLAGASLAATSGAPVLAAVGAAALGLGAYDVLGKRTRWPPLMDLIQGAGWASLLLAGAWLAGGVTPLSIALAGFIAVFIVMANGVHGAIRDLPNDTRHGVRTTASMLGAGSTPDGRRVVPGLVMAYAWTLQATLLAITSVAVVAAGGSTAAVVPAAFALLLLGAATVARSDADLLAAGMLHLLVVLTIPIALVASSAPPLLVAAILATYLLPVLSHGWLPGALAWARRRADRAAAYTRDVVLLTRPHNALAAGLAVIVGARLGGAQDALAEPGLRAALVAGLVVAAANVANDQADVVEDRINRPSRPIAAGRVSFRAAVALATGIAATASLLALTLGPAPAVATAVLTGVAFLYSIRLKGTFLVGNAVVAAMSASTIVFGALVLGVPTPAMAIGAAFVFLSVGSSEVLKSTVDRDGDRAAGRATIATRLSTGACLRVHAGLVVALLVLVLVPTPTGEAPPAFLVASLAGIVGPQLLVLARLRGATDPAAIRRVLPLTKLAWFTGLAALTFLV
jgi:4-hydroxybenzoate polyprenyltransferase